MKFKKGDAVRLIKYKDYNGKIISDIQSIGNLPIEQTINYGHKCIIIELNKTAYKDFPYVLYNTVLDRQIESTFSDDELEIDIINWRERIK
jgi:hypothetical protein